MKFESTENGNRRVLHKLTFGGLCVALLIVACFYGVELSQRKERNSTNSSDTAQSSNEKEAFVPVILPARNMTEIPQNSQDPELNLDTGDLAARVREIQEEAKGAYMLLFKSSEETRAKATSAQNTIRNRIAEAETPADQRQLQAELARSLLESAHKQASIHDARMMEPGFRRTYHLSDLSRFLGPVGQNSKLHGEAGERAKEMEVILATFCRDHKSLTQEQFDQQWNKMKQLEEQLVTDRLDEQFRILLGK